MYLYSRQSNLNCGSGTCSTSISNSRTVTHGATTSLSGVGWISAGFSVSYSRATSESYSCSATRGQRVCVKNWRRYQQYDLVESMFCEIIWRDWNYNTRAPMTDNRHTEYYCMCSTQHCVSNSYTTWENRGSGYHGGVR